MDPLSILSATGTALSITKTIGNTLTTLITQTKNADRNLQQLHQEVTSFAHVLQLLNNDFSDDRMRVAAFETQTGNVGAHWNAVTQAIVKCNERLDELQKLLVALDGSSRLASSGFVKGVGLNYAIGDIVFYQSEIRRYRENIAVSLNMMVVCRVMDPRMAAPTIQPDLEATGTEIRRLLKELRDIKLEASRSKHGMIQRKPVQSPDAIIANPSQVLDEAQPILDIDLIRNYQLETATVLELPLGYASALVSTASTFTGQRLSLDDEFRRQRGQSDPAVLEYIQDHEANAPSSKGKHASKSAEHPAVSAFLLLPRFVVSLLLFAGLLLGIGFAFVVVIFWLLGQALCGFRRWGSDTVKMKRQGRGVFDWFDERWRDIWL